MQSGGGVSLGGQSCLAEEIGSPYTPSISPGAVSRPQRPLARRQRANHVDVDSGMEGDPHGVTDLVGKKPMANTPLPATTGTQPAEMPFSGTAEVPSEEHPLGEQSVQPALVAQAAMASACMVISLLNLLWRHAAPAHRPRRRVCLRRACVALNDMLVAASNASVDPCDNFYEHVCNAWKESTSVYEKHLSLFVDKHEQQNEKSLSTGLHAVSKLSSHRRGWPRRKGRLQEQTKLGITWKHVNSENGELTVTAARVFEAFRISPLITIRKSRIKAGEVFVRIEPGDALTNWVKMRALLVKEGNYRSYSESVADLYNSNTTHTITFQEFNEKEGVLILVLMSADRADAERVELDSMEQLSHYLEPNSFVQLREFLKYGLDLSSSTRVQICAVEYMKRLQEISTQLGEQRLEFYLGCADHRHLFLKQVKRSRWSFISDRVALDQRDFHEVLFHSEQFSKQDLSDVFDTVAMNVSLLHNWMVVARANARIPKGKWRKVSSSYMRQLRESDGDAFSDSQRLTVRIPLLFPMLQLCEWDLTVATTYGTMGTLLGAATVQLFESHLHHNSVALAKVEEKLACFALPVVP
ncbi:hypothetical protein HPB49_008906 [Dermacentor silvarum]|uniref:Uncharacterized protein n=1 Tax=Dermacentor silvarum TaxID=543639 RepID=A0ACB8DIJ1_DERSI|nr:hypothetical protein HPB49_008906 [Dermacentor silvarum]